MSFFSHFGGCLGFWYSSIDSFALSVSLWAFSIPFRWFFFFLANASYAGFSETAPLQSGMFDTLEDKEIDPRKVFGGG